MSDAGFIIYFSSDPIKIDGTVDFSLSLALSLISHH